MVAFTKSPSVRFSLPLILGVLFTLGVLGWKHGRDLARQQEARIQAELDRDLRDLSCDLRVQRAIWNGESPLARSALRILLDQTEGLSRIDLVLRGRRGEATRTLVSLAKPDAGELLPWNGKIPALAQIYRRPDSDHVLGIQPVRSMEDVLGGQTAEALGSSGRAALVYWVDESRLLAAPRRPAWAVWGPILGAGLFLTLMLLWFSGIQERLGQRERLQLRSDLRAARWEIQVLEESFELRVDEGTREIREVMRRLEHLSELKDGFLASVSHELRTPLTSIRSFAEILLQSWYEEEPETRTEFLTIIREESKRICRLINQVLDLEKIEAGRMDWHLESFDLTEMGRKTLRVQEGLRNLKPVDYELDVPEGPVLYCGDQDRLQQVLVNLLSNAWKHSPEGGRIRLSIFEFAGGVELRVEDEGPGVPDSGAREAIFDKFHQEGPGEEPGLASTGLGLPIAREIVHMHGGWISCTDGELGGACFVLLLPHDEGRLERVMGRSETLFRVPAAE